MRLTLDGSSFLDPFLSSVVGDITQMLSPLVIKWIIKFVNAQHTARVAGTSVFVLCPLRSPVAHVVSRGLFAGLPAPNIGNGIGAAIGLSLMLLVASLG